MRERIKVMRRTSWPSMAKILILIGLTLLLFYLLGGFGRWRLGPERALLGHWTLVEWHSTVLPRPHGGDEEYFFDRGIRAIVREKTTTWSEYSVLWSTDHAVKSSLLAQRSKMKKSGSFPGTGCVPGWKYRGDILQRYII